MSRKVLSKNWHVIFPDVRDFDIFNGLNPGEIMDKVCDLWCAGSGRKCMCYFSLSTQGVYHLHCYFTDGKHVCYPGVIYKLFPGTIIEPLRCSLHTFMIFMLESSDEILDYSVGVSEDVI